MHTRSLRWPSRVASMTRSIAPADSSSAPAFSTGGFHTADRRIPPARHSRSVNCFSGFKRFVAPSRLVATSSDRPRHAAPVEMRATISSAPAGVHFEIVTDRQSNVRYLAVTIRRGTIRAMLFSVHNSGIDSFDGKPKRSGRSTISGNDRDR
jgi:hypothetical protein